MFHVAGLLAISYSIGTFLVVDLTSSKIVFRKEQQKKKNRHSINFNLVSDNSIDPVLDFVWTACSMGKGN